MLEWVAIAFSQEMYSSNFIFFFIIQFPLMTPVLPEGQVQQLGNGKRCSLEGLALTEGFAHMLESPFPGKVFSNHCLGLLTASIQSPPYI